MPSEDQSAASKVCLVVTPALAALEQVAPQTECDLNVPIAIPASLMVDLSHLAMVEEVYWVMLPNTGEEQCCLKARRLQLKVMTGHMTGLNRGKKKSVKCQDALLC